MRIASVLILLLLACPHAGADEGESGADKAPAAPQITRPDGTVVRFFEPEFVSIDALHDGLEALGVPRVRVLRFRDQGMLALDGEPELVKRALEALALLDRPARQVAVEADVLIVRKRKGEGTAFVEGKSSQADAPQVVVLGERPDPDQVLRALRVSGTARVAASISVLATQGIESKVEQTTQHPEVVISEVRDTDAIHRTTSMRAGLVLKVTPVHVGKRYVTLRVAPSINGLWNAAPLLTPTAHPTQTSHTAVATITIEAGKTAAIARLKRKSTSERTTDPKVVVHQPLRGNGGPRGDEHDEEVEFIVTITPRLVSPAGQAKPPK